MSTRLPISSANPSNRDEVVHRMLASSHAQRLSPAFDSLDFEGDLQRDVSIRRFERAFIEAARAAIAPALRDVPTESVAFVNWFEALKEHGPGQHDALFPWLAEHATHRQMCWFLQQELAGKAGFDDLVALTQVKLPSRPKLEMARNYWDEMGQGNAGGMHGPMLGALACALDLRPDGNDTVWQALALSNLMVALATARQQLANLAALVARQRPRLNVWCVFDNRAAGAALSDALRFRQLLAQAAPILTSGVAV